MAAVITFLMFSYGDIKLLLGNWPSLISISCWGLHHGSGGYRYVHFQSRYDSLTQCPLGRAICIRGKVASDFQFDAFAMALSSKTPLIDALCGFAPGRSDRYP